MTKTNDPRCATCGHPRSNHPYRHPFAGPGSPLAPRPKGKTKRVRIAVGTDRSGSVYVAPMRSWASPSEALEHDYGDDMKDLRLSIVEADVPLPEEPATVRGEVVDG